jgi:MFS family permease
MSDGCTWNHTATGIEYEVLAGPAFTLVFTLVALPLGMLASSTRVNRKLAIAVCVGLWSAMTLASSFSQTFWQLLLTRIGLGVL